MEKIRVLVFVLLLWHLGLTSASTRMNDNGNKKKGRRLHYVQYRRNPNVFTTKMTTYAGSRYWANNRYYKGYTKGKGYVYYQKGKGYSKGYGADYKGKGKGVPAPSPSPPLVLTSTPPPHGECFPETGENGECGRNCDFSFAGGDLCPRGEACCASCNQNDLATECCLSSDCGQDYACRYNKCICEHECCLINDCGDAIHYMCINNQCEQRNCDILATNAECCADTDCPIGYVCEESVCIAEGNPRFTLTWFGDGTNAYARD